MVSEFQIKISAKLTSKSDKVPDHSIYLDILNYRENIIIQSSMLLSQVMSRLCGGSNVTYEKLTLPIHENVSTSN